MGSRDRCAVCNSIILETPLMWGQLQFCSTVCVSRMQATFPPIPLASTVVDEAVVSVFTGLCPECHRRGPVDLHSAHSITSILIRSQWQTQSIICCRPCAKRKQLAAIFSSFLKGWWCLPWGPIFTPGQIVRNLVEMIRDARSVGPSQSLREHLTLNLAHRGLYRPPPSDKCVHCGYDIRAQRESDSPRCPECGNWIYRARRNT